MHEKVCYDKPFLKQVIVRVDFAAGAEALTDKIPAAVAGVALRLFPINEPRPQASREVVITRENVSQKLKSYTEWNYHGREREKRLAISREYMFIETSHYKRYENLTGDFQAVLEALQKAFPDLLVSRLGLRYINHIELQNVANLYDWSPYLNAHMLGLLAHFSNRGELTRALNIVELRRADIGLKFQFGMPNPDHPAAIRRPLFVLDLDAHASSIAIGEVSAHLNAAHDYIQELFEESITDRLREAMGAQRA